MSNITQLKSNEEMEKIPVLPGDAVFIRYEKNHRPVIKVFRGVVPC